ncbi:MAG: M13 family metallopeptidase [Sphingomonas bacterium]
MLITRRDALIGLGTASLGLNAGPGENPTVLQSAVRPGDDFYRYADAADIAAMTIPADRWDYGQFDVAGKEVMHRIAALVERAANRGGANSPTERRVAAAYRSILDEAAITRAGPARLKRDLGRIMAAGSHADVGALMAHPRSSSLIAFNVFPAQGEWMVHLDQQNQNQPMLELSTGAYSATDAQSVKLRDAYRHCIAQLFELAGISDASRRAGEVVALDGEIARRQWGFEKLRDRRANLHVMTVTELEALAPGLPWRAMLTARGVAGVERINLGTDSAVAAQAALFRETPVDSWRSWLAFSWMRNGIDTLPASMRGAYWTFLVARGAVDRPKRAEEALRFVNSQMRMGVARLYIEAHFPEAARERAEEMLAYLKRAMAERLRTTAWLDAPSRAEALAKLDAMALKAGYPRSWPIYRGGGGLRADDAAGNLETLLREAWAAQFGRLGKASPQQELWYQSPQTVDASYSVLLNTIELPAAILQPPFFSDTAHPAENFGAIGALVGHEMGHGFNDQGLLFDSKGILRDWMSADAQAAFATRAEQLVAQYGAFEPLPGLKLNGRRTLGENIADLSGVSLALRAYELYRAERGDTLDAAEARRKLFLSWARVWVYKAPDSAIRYIVENSDHAPAPCRVNGVVRNLDAWYEAFDVAPRDALYLAPDARVRLW